MRYFGEDGEDSISGGEDDDKIFGNAVADDLGSEGNAPGGNFDILFGGDGDASIWATRATT